ncbi:hypothetical protein BDV93DRAFT_484731 [Ceratobasidium sp. AG-I]|nr:hypothetical protein BDV93DRAFT_484731 [Ceratobasidium sp. AG-I]
MNWHMNRALRASALSLSSASRLSKPAAWCFPRQLSSLHQRRALEYPLENGLGKFLTPEGLKTIAVEWQEGLLDRLNEEVRDTEFENQSVMQVVISTATQKSNSLAFMYASQALNNSFFLDNLKPLADGQTSHEEGISAALNQKIAFDFGSLGHLKSTISAAALGMSSSGWVWCVQDANGSIGVVPTFGPGTVLVRNRIHSSPNFTPVVGERLDPRPPSPTSPKRALSTASPASGASTNRAPVQSLSPQIRTVVTQAPAYNTGDVLSGSRIGDFTKAGNILSPLFCISVNEHAWISSGYGVWGKEEYLKQFWSVLDWEKVSRNSEHWTRSSTIQ